MITISARLHKIAEQVPCGARLADIGSDHALLPVYLAAQGNISFAVAGEVNEGPYQAARRQVEGRGLADRIAVRKGDGLEVVAPGEVDVVTIAGMGGGLISAILERGKARLDGVFKLILQPNVGAQFVRRWLMDNGWYLQREEILAEDGKIYEILCAVKTEAAAFLNRKLYEGAKASFPFHLPQEMIVKMGPHLLRQAGPVFRQKWRQELSKMDKIAAQLSRAQTAEAAQKKEELRAEMEMIREVLQCLPKDKR